MSDLPPQPPSDDPTQVDVPAVPPAGTWTPITAPDPAAVPPVVEADPADAAGPAYGAAPAAGPAPAGTAGGSASWKAWVGAGVAAAVLALIAGFVIARNHDDSSAVSANGANGANGSGAEGAGGPNGSGGQGGPGFRGGFGTGGTITAIDGSTITLKGQDGANASDECSG